jgi:uridine kinase
MQQTSNPSIQLMQEKKTDIIIIRGCPGSGKSQTAKSLSQVFSERSQVRS